MAKLKHQLELPLSASLTFKNRLSKVLIVLATYVVAMVFLASMFGCTIPLEWKDRVFPPSERSPDSEKSSYTVPPLDLRYLPPCSQTPLN